MTGTGPSYRVALSGAIRLAVLALVAAGLLHFLGNHTTFLYSIRGLHGFVPPLGTLLEPHHGLWYTARLASHGDERVEIAGLKEPVTIVRDERGVPHVFAATTRDAVIATGYVVAQDRLFQLDFIARAASGRLASIFGPDLLPTDRYLRSTGMEWAARRNLDSTRVENGIDNELLQWFAIGVNAHLEGLKEYQFPLEFRLLGYEPEPYEPINGLRVLEFMAYDLSFHTDAISYGRLREMMSAEEYAKLFPRHSRLYVPIVPGPPDEPASPQDAPSTEPNSTDSAAVRLQNLDDFSLTAVPATADHGGPPVKDLLPGFEPGKGSNNWAVTGHRSMSGGALLAGDMHLELNLPAIWYEIHIATPGLNTHGVLIPGAPLPVEAFNDHHGWTFTNTGSDQIDHYKLVLDSTRTHYRFNEKWVAFDLLVDSIDVRGVGTVADTVRMTRFGPVMGWPDDPVAVQWTAHKPARTLQALWAMHTAEDAASFQDALRLWDTPMQNILYADVEGNIAIRSAGHLPIRRSGTGAGLLDGTRGAGDWVGRVSFDELPFASNPESGFLASANQQPAGKWYPYYLGHDWYRTYRSMRINDLLNAKPRHDLGDMMAYQADIHVVQRDLFVPMMDTLTRLSEEARFIRNLLVDWEGEAGLEQTASLALDEYLTILENLAWDEFDRENLRRPRQSQLHYLLTDEPNSRWLDIRDTDLIEEGASDLVRLALEATADTMRAKYGWDQALWRWDLHHALIIRHVTKAPPLAALNVGPLSYPGFANTLSPAARRMSTHSASWRMIVDFSKSPPEGYGIYPGGQSGNPYSRLYADQVPMFVNFGYYRLTRPSAASFIAGREIASTVKLEPFNPPSEIAPNQNE